MKFKLIFLGLIFVFLSGCQQKQLYRDNRVMMGTFIEVISPEKGAAGIAFAEIKRIENLLSKYNPESEIARLNELGELSVSPETFFVIEKSLEFWQASAGAFDITVAPLVDLWGFTEKNFVMPEDQEIKKALALVGSDKIILNNKDNVIKFMLPGMKIDLGAIAKGYALDCAQLALKKQGIKSCLINAGGQVSCMGDKFGVPWKAAIKAPGSAGLSGELELKNQSAATSGDYQQYFIKDNKRYAHIFNPQTGYPVETKIRSVTVISPDGLTADALATAIFVLGKDKGRALAGRFPMVEVRIYE